LSRQRSRQSAIDSEEAFGHGDHTPATRHRVGTNDSSENNSSISLRVAGGSPAMALSTPAMTSARAATASSGGIAPLSSSGTIAATMSRADASSGPAVAAEIAGGTSDV